MPLPWMATVKHVQFATLHPVHITYHRIHRSNDHAFCEYGTFHLDYILIRKPKQSLKYMYSWLKKRITEPATEQTLTENPKGDVATYARPNPEDLIPVWDNVGKYK